ncbi:hypothetical protein M9458_008953, partial [Cirrhinus mrigala]
ERSKDPSLEEPVNGHLEVEDVLRMTTQEHLTSGSENPSTARDPIAGDPEFIAATEDPITGETLPTAEEQRSPSPGVPNSSLLQRFLSFVAPIPLLLQRILSPGTPNSMLPERIWYPVVLNSSLPMRESSLPQSDVLPEFWLQFTRGLKPDLALREKAYFQQQQKRWAPYLYVRPDQEELLNERGITVGTAADRESPLPKATKDIGCMCELIGRGAEESKGCNSNHSS